MTAASLTRRLGALESSPRFRRKPNSFVVMPWDIAPDAADGDALLTVHFVRPTDQPSREWVPYARTGIHPALDAPESPNAQLYNSSASDQAWTARRFATGASLVMPYNGREPLEGHTHA